MAVTRLDKWLWAARFFKTRALAARACELGRVRIHGHAAKPAHDVRLGDRLEIRTEAGEFQVAVLSQSGIRGPASVAQGMYLESEESRELRARAAAERKAMAQQGLSPEGKPSRRDRQAWNRLRGRF